MSIRVWGAGMSGTYLRAISYYVVIAYMDEAISFG